jgi:hypothetical protein
MGERFIDALLADTLSERYRPSEVDDDHQRLMDAGVRIAHTYAKQRERIAMLDVCEAAEDAMRAWQKVLKTGDETIEVETCDDHDCLRSPLGRLCDWFAGLFSVDSVAMPID